MSQGGRIALIFVGVAAIAGGAGYYFLKNYRPQQVLQDAQAQVTDWETRWTAARSCLLGAKPGSSRTSEAIAIRELTPDPWDRKSCTALIAKLTRGDMPGTGLDAVENAWVEVDRAATKAATAFATHISE